MAHLKCNLLLDRYSAYLRYMHSHESENIKNQPKLKKFPKLLKPATGFVFFDVGTPKP